MESRLQILGVFSLLLLSAGMAAIQHMLLRNLWFRKHESHSHDYKKSRTDYLQCANSLKQLTIETRLQLLRWLSLLQLPLRPGSRSHIALLRRT